MGEWGGWCVLRFLCEWKSTSFVATTAKFQELLSQKIQMKFPPPEPPSEALLVSVGRAGNNRSIKAHCMATHLSSSSSRFLLRPATSEDVTKILEINHSFFQYSKTELPVAQKEGEKQETSEGKHETVGHPTPRFLRVLSERIKQEDEALLEAQKQQAVARTRTQWLSENIAHLCEENKGFLLSKFAREEVEVCMRVYLSLSLWLSLPLSPSLPLSLSL